MVQVLLAPLVISGSISREIDGVAQAGRADLTLPLPLTLPLITDPTPGPNQAEHAALA